MKNFIAMGDTITVPAPAAIASGAPVMVGALFGVAVNTAALAAPLQLKTTGIFDLPKAASQAWTVGAPIYWDAGDEVCTNVDEDNVLIGVAMLAVGAGAGETTGRVRLNGTFGVPVVEGA